MALTHKELPAFDVKDLGNGTAQFVVGLGPIEIDVRMDADQVDDLQSALEAAGRSMEEYHRAQEAGGPTERAWRQ